MTNAVNLIEVRTPFVKVQHYGQVAAGKVIPFPSDSLKTIEVPLSANLRNPKHIIAYTVLGDCLATADPRTSIYDGDDIVARTVFEKSEVCNRICILRIYGSEMLAKRIRCNKDGTLTLSPSNPNTFPITLPAEEVEVLAVVVEFIRKI